MPHLFLTGDRRTGKSALIRAFLLRSGLSADGFMTYWEGDDDGGRCLFLSEYDTDPSRSGRRFVVARRPAGDGSLVAPDAVAFDTHGARIVAASGRRDVTVMDELGFLESGAAGFQAAVLARLAAPIPVIGVLRARHTPFLDVVVSRPDVRVVAVTAENRGTVVDALMAAWSPVAGA